MPTVLDLQPIDDPRDIVHRTVQALVEGHVVALPTETCYVLAADALNERAVAKLVNTVGSTTHPPILSLRSLDAAGDYFCSTSPLAERLSRRCWPGPLTLVVPCQDEKSATRQLPLSVQQQITAADHCVGFRVINHRVFSHLHRYLAAPLVLAEPSGGVQGPPISLGQIDDAIVGKIPLLLDDGPTRYGVGSTIVRVMGNRWKLLREGAIEQAAMNQLIKPVIALVCTGNTCRSPMAETLMRELLRRKFGCEDAVRVLSAGVAAAHGSGATAQAIEVMGRQGLDLTGHCSRPFDESVVQVADLVLTMTRGHRDAILAAYPDLHDRVFTLRRDGGDISDPVGMPVEVYEACAAQIESELTQWIETLGDDFFPTSETPASSESRSSSDPRNPDAK